MTKRIFQNYKRAFAEALASNLGLKVEDVFGQLKNAEPQHGDLAFPTFQLAKLRKKAPPAIAAELASQIKIPNMTVAAIGPYLNAQFSPTPFIEAVVNSSLMSETRFGHGTTGQDKTVVIDYSSPNIAKPIAFHHIRSTVIGNALANMYRSQGFRVAGINYLGDWGKQFGLVAIGFQEYGDPARRHDMQHLVEVYVKANARAEKEPAFDERARAFFRSMEDKDPQALMLWREFRETSLKEFQKIYQRLGVQFEHYEGESFYQDKMEQVIAEIHKTVGTRTSEGALIVDLPYAENEPPILLRKNDGSTLYATRDIAAAIDRFERFHFTKSLYVIATDQSLHIKQLVTVLEKMGKPWAKDCLHVNFGRVHGMGTRKGNIVLLTDVLDEAKERALEKVRANIDQGRMQVDNPEELAEQIGLGAIFFADLKNRRISDYDFDWDEVLNFEGHTGPYLQYAHARASTVLRKATQPISPERFNPARLVLPEELDLVRAIAQLPEAIDDVLRHEEPSFVARALLEIGAHFSRWYTLGNQDRNKRVLVEDDNELQQARVALTGATRYALASGLALLGIPAPETM